MPIFSYLAIPKQSALETLCSDLRSTSYCDVMLSDDQKIIILITDTPDEKAEKVLQQRLKALKSLDSLCMTFGHADEEKTGN